MAHTIYTRFFRGGVGTVIYTEAGEVALFKRATPPVDVWQFQQGGIDAGEAPEETLWRELREEVGLGKADFSSVLPYPNWTIYEDQNSQNDPSIPRLGQAHRWFFLALKPDAIIDLAKATEVEMSEYTFTTFENAIELAADNKKPLYRTLERYFFETVLKVS